LKRGLLLIDRGSREREASEELDVICQGIKAKGDYVFTDFCFLEVEPPYIEDGITKCLKEDIDSLTIVPYFLYPGKKVKNAVTDVMKFQKDTKIKFVVTKQMSMHKTLVDVVENRISTTLENELKDSYRNVSRCWLEIEQPDIFEGIKKCEKDDPKVLIIVFYFLHEGAHVKTDINNDLIPALKNSSMKKTYITKHIGTDQKMIDLILERAKEVEDAN
jgi:sirohydrochlorin ferrochelatase